MPEDDIAGDHAMAAAFASYAPGFKGPTTPCESDTMRMDVTNKAAVENTGFWQQAVAVSATLVVRMMVERKGHLALR